MREIEIVVPPEVADHPDALQSRIAKAAGVKSIRPGQFTILRRSLDARKRPPVFRFKIALSTSEQIPEVPSFFERLPFVREGREVYIIGAGPAGYFAALECLLQGMKPVVIERGKDVQLRRRDLRAIQQDSVVNPNSNYCFGEGGAGTYSDGKLYTRSGKRGNIDQVLQILTEAGADPEIRYEAHPHIGSNKLPPMIANIREVIEAHGGVIRFDSILTDIDVTSHTTKRVTGIEINGSEKIKTDTVVLATGHSARDIFLLLKNRGIHLEPKPFALGVRIEHPQSFIDQCQYGVTPRGDHLPAASYALNTQVKERGVFSFCMCPGGLIVPSATAPGEIVVNGMSLSRRDSPFANSGLVSAIELKDIQEHFSMENDRQSDPLRMMYFQREVEQRMFEAGTGSQAAPAQRVHDFMNRQPSKHLPQSSYIPGLWPAPLHALLPDWVGERIRGGLTAFNRRMNGYLHPEAILVGVESRTSSPVRIPRSPQYGMHPEVEGLFPCGEGAGYAGGIMSAAMDGQFIARCVAQFVNRV